MRREYFQKVRKIVKMKLDIMSCSSENQTITEKGQG